MNIIPRSTLPCVLAFLSSTLPLLAQVDETAEPTSHGSAVGGAIGGLIGLVVAVVMVVAMWKLFVKAGQPGWASIIPIYNLYVLLKIVGRPGWWLALILFIPFVNFIIIIILLIDLAKSFGKGGGFAAGLILLAPIFILILGLGDARYVGPAAAAPPAA